LFDNLLAGFFDLANASTHTNYLIQIVKEHLLHVVFIEFTLGKFRATKKRKFSSLFDFVASTFSKKLNIISFKFCRFPNAGRAYYIKLLFVYTPKLKKLKKLFTSTGFTF
jgi:hypothetical protein